MRPFQMNDQEWDKGMVLALRAEIIKLRDDMLKANNFDYTVKLSLVVGCLQHMAEDYDVQETK